MRAGNYGSARTMHSLSTARGQHPLKSIKGVASLDTSAKRKGPWKMQKGTQHKKQTLKVNRKTGQNGFDRVL
jgi:hypothetical protein